MDIILQKEMFFVSPESHTPVRYALQFLQTVHINGIWDHHKRVPYAVDVS
jgi:hypothetical protein